MERDILFKFFLSGASGAVAETVTFPLDLVKTRLQLQGEGGRLQGRPQGALAIFTSVVKAQGPTGLYAGLGPAVARHIPYTGTRIVVYEYLRCALRFSKKGEDLPLVAKLGMGMTAGAVGQLVAVPTDLVKIRMQADGRLMAAGQMVRPRYRGLLHGLGTVLKEEGLRGLWRGSSPAVQRAALVNLGELTTYDQAKSRLLGSGLVGDNAALHAAASVCSGFVSSVISTPADVIKTRLMNQEKGSQAYRGSLHCLTQAVQTEGFLALYKGFFPTWARLGPWQLCFWLTYEQLRNLLDLPSF
eukprot:jgi/Botrbrau1/16562/Bobra.0385s0005.1